jgi:hypothetical protein
MILFLASSVKKKHNFLSQRTELSQLPDFSGIASLFALTVDRRIFSTVNGESGMIRLPA